MRRTRRNKKIIILVFFLVVILFWYYFFVVIPIVKTYSAQETKAITERAVNFAVSNVINRTLSYDTLIDINYSPAGEIASFSANQYEINTITREIVKETQYQMNHIGESGLPIQIGTFSGIPFLIGRGPVMRLNLVPIGVVNGNFESQFSSVGINMTKHTLFLQITVHVSIVLPIKSYDIYSTNQVLLAESIIVGRVPEVYLNGGGLIKYN
jgi:sporulation protein YunB